MSEHAVIVCLKPAGRLDLAALEDRLAVELEHTASGEYDGNEIALDGSEAILYFYGPDADALWTAVAPALRAQPVASGSHATKRYGTADDPTARTERVPATDW